MTTVRDQNLVEPSMNIAPGGSVLLTHNAINGRVLIQAQGTAINGSLWSRIKAAWRVIWRPETLIHRTQVVLSCNMIVTDGVAVEVDQDEADLRRRGARRRFK